MPNYVNIGVAPKTRAKLRLIAQKTNLKMSQIVDDALKEYAKIFLPNATKDDRLTIER